MTAPVTHPAGLPTGALTRLHAQAVELEGVFLNTLVKEMFSSIGRNTEFGGGGYAEETWRGMLSEQLATTFAQSGGIGLADSLMPELLAMQERAGAMNSVSPGAGTYR